VLLVGVLYAASRLLPIKDYLVSLLQWADGLGVWGPVVVVASYVVACVLLLPGSVLTLGAGFLFGVLEGTITVSIGSTLGACAAFLVGRTVARGWVERKVSGDPRFAAIDRAVGGQGFKIVLLTRLSPIFPFNLQNYGYGLTQVRFWDYALASWIGMVPGTVMFVYFGAAAGSLAEVAAGQVEGGAAQRIFFWVGLVVTLCVAAVVTRIARRALRQAMAEEETEEASASEERDHE
jgi:uncharacterized membrane protein YdjX (TVP38/TMEM64 family)